MVATATTWPLAARAQQAERMRRIGVLVGLAEDDPFIKARLAGFGRRAIEPAETRIGTRYHPGQRLFDLMSNRGRDCIPGHQPRLARIHDERSVADALAGAYGVVNAVSLYVEHGQGTFHSVHVESAKRVAVMTRFPLSSMTVLMRAGEEQFDVL